MKNPSQSTCNTHEDCNLVLETMAGTPLVTNTYIADGDLDVDFSSGFSCAEIASNNKQIREVAGLTNWTQKKTRNMLP